VFRPFLLCLLLIPSATLAAAGCRGDEAQSADAAGGRQVEAVVVETAAVVEQAVERFVTVSGTLAAQEDADVAAEISGRVEATPVERGSRVSRDDTLIRIADVEVAAQMREADANAGQIEARLGTTSSGVFEVERVAEVANARAAYELARTDFARTKMLQERQLVSRAEFDQREAQVEAARRQYDVARNGAEQQYQALLGARARVALARKALADTLVRAPFDGVVAERLVSVGDYVTRGTKIASVMRVSPLRLELTVPAQYVTAMAVGSAVRLEVDAYPSEVFAGQVRFVSPALRSDTRALVVEALVPNADGRLKPGLFATAHIAQSVRTPALLLPAAAVQQGGGTARVFVVTGERAEERLVTTGRRNGDRIEITSGLAVGDRVVVRGGDGLRDGAPVKTAPAARTAS
jgi:RND family efflux transporter MFP subunit